MSLFIIVAFNRFPRVGLKNIHVGFHIIQRNILISILNTMLTICWQLTRKHERKMWWHEYTNITLFIQFEKECILFLWNRTLLNSFLLYSNHGIIIIMLCMQKLCGYIYEHICLTRIRYFMYYILQMYVSVRVLPFICHIEYLKYECGYIWYSYS